MHSELIIALGTCHSLDVENLLTYGFLFALEEIVELDWSHHLAGAVEEFDQDDALVF